MEPSIISLIPPLLIIVTAYFTQRILLAFSIGIFSGAFLAARGCLQKTTTIIAKYLWSSSGLESLYTHDLHANGNLAIFFFLFVLGSIIVLVKQSGGAAAYRAALRARIKNARSAETTSLLLSLFFFIDDYFSALTVGLLMQPITDSFKVSRIKLAFLIDAMAAPLAVLSPISSWVGEIVAQLQNSGVRNDGSHLTIIKGDPFQIFLKTIPSIFYSLILIATVFFIVRRRISFGLMKKYEADANYKEYLNDEPRGKARDFLIPMIVLIGAIFLGFLYSGGWWNVSWYYALTHPHVYTALAWGSAIALLATSIYFIIFTWFSVSTLLRAYKDGFFLMFPAMCMLLFAWTSGKIITYELQTGHYLASIFGTLIPIVLFPAFCFGLSFVTTLAIGSAWATIGIMFPLIIPMIPIILQSSPPITVSPIIFTIIGSVLSGALAGMQTSFFSDTPLLASTSTRARHIHRMHAQIRYLIPIIICTMGAYILCAFLLHAHWSYSFSVIMSFGLSLLVTLLYFEYRHRQ